MISKIFLIATFITYSSLAKLGISQDTTIYLYSPDELSLSMPELQEKREKGDILWVTDITNPRLEVFLPTPKSSRNIGVIIAPGGGYGGLAYDWEGTDIAKWFNANGVSAFVLNYRCPTYELDSSSHQHPLKDAARAVTLVRSLANKWGLRNDKIGFMGFSAGGHLAATLATHFQTPAERPDFVALIYPVISMQTDITHSGSKYNLLGSDPLPSLVEYYSNEKHVSDNTPPVFLVHSTDDRGVNVLNSIRFYEACVLNNIPAAMHIFPYGGHGYALATGRGYLAQWSALLLDWILNLGVEK